jgi:hypothetical protein
MTGDPGDLHDHARKQTYASPRPLASPREFGYDPALASRTKHGRAQACQLQPRRGPGAGSST